MKKQCINSLFEISLRYRGLQRSMYSGTILTEIRPIED